MPAFLNYIRGSKLTYLLRAAGTLLVSMAALSLGVVGFSQVRPDGGNDGGTPSTSPSATVAPIVLQIASPERSIVLPTGDEPRRLTFLLTFTGDATKRSLHRGSGEGLDLHPGDDEWLRAWLEDLAACATGTRPLELRIVGFSSSSDWGADLSRRASDRLNLLLANRRAEVLRTRIEALLASPRLAKASGWIVVKASPWGSFADMRDHRLFNERGAAAQYPPQRGRLTRRAEIWVDAAGCDAGGRTLEVASTSLR